MKLARRSRQPGNVARIATIGVALVASVAHATLLIPGNTVAPAPTTLVGATLVLDSGPQPFASVDGSSFTGSVRTHIYTNDSASPFGPNTLTFTWQITNNGPDALERFVCVRNQGFVTDVYFIATDGEAVPSTVDRSFSGANVGWDYSGTSGIPAGGRSALLVMRTNGVHDYYPRVDYLINGSVATVNSFGVGPLTEPEPSGAIVAMLGAGAAVLRHRARRPTYASRQSPLFA